MKNAHRNVPEQKTWDTMTVHEPEMMVSAIVATGGHAHGYVMPGFGCLTSSVSHGYGYPISSVLHGH